MQYAPTMHEDYLRSSLSKKLPKSVALLCNYTLADPAAALSRPPTAELTTQAKTRPRESGHLPEVGLLRAIILHHTFESSYISHRDGPVARGVDHAGSPQTLELTAHGLDPQTEIVGHLGPR